MGLGLGWPCEPALQHPAPPAVAPVVRAGVRVRVRVRVRARVRVRVRVSIAVLPVESHSLSLLCGHSAAAAPPGEKGSFPDPKLP